MDALLRCFLPSITIRPPGWRIKRFFRRLWYAVTDALAIIGAAALMCGIWYLCFLY